MGTPDVAQMLIQSIRDEKCIFSIKKVGKTIHLHIIIYII